MPRFGPISWRELIAYLHDAGFEGPLAGTRHAIMVRGDITVRLPNLHHGDIGRDLLARFLRQAGIERDEWERL